MDRCCRPSKWERAAVKAAVTTLVFSHTHIVRLRVSRGAELLADVGGPYILAPVGGTLRSRGRSIGPLRPLGPGRPRLCQARDPLHRRSARHALRARTRCRWRACSPGPASIPGHGPVSYPAEPTRRTRSARGLSERPLRISLLCPCPVSLVRKSCNEIKVAELGEVARRISRRFTLSPTSFSSYIKRPSAHRRARLHPLGLPPARRQHPPGPPPAAGPGHGELSRQ